MFHDTHVEPKHIEDTGSADVHKILSKIKEKWQIEAKTSPDVLEETIVAPIADLKQPGETIISRQGEALMEEAVLESSHHMGEKQRGPIERKQDDIPETIIAQPFERTNIETDEGDIPETIIAQPFGKINEASSPSTPLSSENMHFQQEGYTSEKTREQDTRRRKEPLEPEEDDFFTQTVILSPNKDKNRD